MPSPVALSQGALQEVLSQQDGAAAGKEPRAFPQGWNVPALPFSSGFWGQGVPSNAWIVQGPEGSSSSGDPGPARSYFVIGERNVSDQGQNTTWTDKKEVERFVTNPRGAVPHPAGMKLGKFQFSCLPWQRVFSPPAQMLNYQKPSH